MQFDYLKYWRVVRYYIKSKHGLTQADLDVLLFLYSEKYFDKDKFQEFNELLSWDVKRFDKLLKEKWIEVFRKRQGKKKGVYSFSYKAINVVRDIYKKLNGNEFPESPSSNPLFLKQVSYTDKVYRNFIKELNASIKRQQHPSHLK